MYTVLSSFKLIFLGIFICSTIFIGVVLYKDSDPKLALKLAFVSLIIALIIVAIAL